MTNEEYHSRSELSKSDLDLLAKSPFHLKNKELFKIESQAFNLGSAVHKLVLEKEDFEKEFTVSPAIDKRTKVGKEMWKEFVVNSDGKTVLTADEYEAANNMTASIEALKASAKFLSDGLPEQSYFGELEGVPCRCRPDYYNTKLGLVVDLKTTQDGSSKGFASSVAKFNYHIQVAFYSDLMRSLGHVVNKFLFIVVEKSSPHMVSFYELDEVAIEQGRTRYKELLELYKYCKENNEWWGYANFDGKKINAVQTLSLPTWKFYE